MLRLQYIPIRVNTTNPIYYISSRIPMVAFFFMIHYDQNISKYHCESNTVAWRRPKNSKTWCDSPSAPSQKHHFLWVVLGFLSHPQSEKSQNAPPPCAYGPIEPGRARRVLDGMSVGCAWIILEHFSNQKLAEFHTTSPSWKWLKACAKLKGWFPAIWSSSVVISHDFWSFFLVIPS